jgi:hypothetical protein
MAETDEIDVTIIITEFASAKQASEALEDLGRWTRKPGKSAVSVYRLVEEGVARIVVAVTLTETGLADPIIRRLKRKGGRLRDLPDEQKELLVERTLEAMGRGGESERRNVLRPLEKPPSDADLN